MFLIFLSNYSIMEAGYKSFWVKFKSQILALIFIGMMMLVFVILLAPDRSEQILDTLTILAVFLITIPFLLILFRHLFKDKP